MIRGIAIAALLSASCASSHVSSIRFKNKPTVWRVNDRVPLSHVPAARGFPRFAYYFDRFFARPTERLTELRAPRHAINVNAIDEVPDSTWFTNRVGKLSPGDVQRGPNRSPGPVRTGKWTVTGTKVGGKSAGLLIEDSSGAKFILKFDEQGFPEIETAANVIAQRILWAAGFNVPEDDIVIFDRADLVLAKNAVIADTFGNKRTMTEDDLNAVFAKIDAQPGGDYRGMTSRFLDGVPLGGAPPEGVRKDDPNDVVPHQHRRELRGQYVIFSWINHTDVKEDNTLDMLVLDEAGNQYVRHYLVDFGKALGTAGAVESRADDGYGFLVDFQYIVASAFGAGLWRRPWEGADGPTIRGVGRFESRKFKPYNWRPAYPWEPFLERDNSDGFWGAKIVAQFSPEMIRAAVEAGRYTDPRATDYVTKILVERRRKILAYWFTRVSPLAEFSVREGQLCFTDYGHTFLSKPALAATQYAVRSFDYEGKSVGGGALISGAFSGQSCVPIPGRAASHDGYTIVQIAVTRSNVTLPATEVHIANGERGLRVIGLIRR